MELNIELLHGDCLGLMRDIPDESIDMILCDLPYGTTGSKWDSVIPSDELWSAYRRIISPNGAIVLFGTEPFATHMRYDALDLYKYDWIWRKTTVTGFAHARNMPLRDYENIMVFFKAWQEAYVLRSTRLGILPPNGSLAQTINCTALQDFCKHQRKILRPKANEFPANDIGF